MSMGLYIKNMEMPDISDYNGINCCLYKTLGGQLRLRNNETGQSFEAVPVPPHGDLIDRDAFMDSDDDLWDGMWGLSGVQIANAPTIIPAEEGET